MDANTTIRLNSGRPMPVLGLGTWQLTNDTAGTVVAALEAGYRMLSHGPARRRPGTWPGRLAL